MFVDGTFGNKLTFCGLRSGLTSMITPSPSRGSTRSRLRSTGGSTRSLAWTSRLGRYAGSGFCSRAPWRAGRPSCYAGRHLVSWEKQHGSKWTVGRSETPRQRHSQASAWKRNPAWAGGSQAPPPPRWCRAGVCPRRRPAVGEEPELPRPPRAAGGGGAGAGRGGKPPLPSFPLAGPPARSLREGSPGDAVQPLASPGREQVGRGRGHPETTS